MHAGPESGNKEDVGNHKPTVHALADQVVNRCFLYLVNYSKLKPDTAMRALPILVNVCFGLLH